MHLGVPEGNIGGIIHPSVEGEGLREAGETSRLGGGLILLTLLTPSRGDLYMNTF